MMSDMLQERSWKWKCWGHEGEGLDGETALKNT